MTETTFWVWQILWQIAPISQSSKSTEPQFHQSSKYFGSFQPIRHRDCVILWNYHSLRLPYRRQWLWSPLDALKQLIILYLSFSPNTTHSQYLTLSLWFSLYLSRLLSLTRLVSPFLSTSLYISLSLSTTYSSVLSLSISLAVYFSCYLNLFLG